MIRARPHVRRVIGGPSSAYKCRGLCRMAGTEPHAWRTSLMNDITYVGLDVHKATVCVAVAENGRGGEVRHLGVFEKPLHPALRQHSRQELRRDIAIEQPVTVLGERRRVPNHLVDAKTDEPTEQQVVFDPLDQLTLRPDRVKRLKQQRPNKPLRRNRLPTDGRVQPVSYTHLTLPT